MQLGAWLRSPHCPALSPQGWGLWCLSHEDVLKPQLLKHKLSSSCFFSRQVRPLMYFLDCDPCFLFVPSLISSKGLKTLMSKNFPRRSLTSQYLWISTSAISFFLLVLCGLSSADLLTHCILQPSVTLIISGSKNMKEEKALSSCTDWAILSLIWGVKKKTTKNQQQPKPPHTCLWAVWKGQDSCDVDNTMQLCRGNTATCSRGFRGASCKQKWSCFNKLH